MSNLYLDFKALIPEPADAVCVVVGVADGLRYDVQTMDGRIVRASGAGSWPIGASVLVRDLAIVGAAGDVAPAAVFEV